MLWQGTIGIASPLLYLNEGGIHRPPQHWTLQHYFLQLLIWSSWCFNFSPSGWCLLILDVCSQPLRVVSTIEESQVNINGKKKPTCIAKEMVKTETRHNTAARGHKNLLYWGEQEVRKLRENRGMVREWDETKLSERKTWQQWIEKRPFNFEYKMNFGSLWLVCPQILLHKPISRRWCWSGYSTDIKCYSGRLVVQGLWLWFLYRKKAKQESHKSTCKRQEPTLFTPMSALPEEKLHCSNKQANSKADYQTSLRQYLLHL